MWATPQPYLHRTMLEILAQEASDLMLPEIEEAARDDGCYVLSNNSTMGIIVRRSSHIKMSYLQI